jgi:hypothetical protein
MSIKSKWIKFKGGVDYAFSGMTGESVSHSVIYGGISGSISALLIGFVHLDSAQDFSAHLEEDIAIHGDGALLRFPDDCNLDSYRYLISQKPDGTLELSRGDSETSDIQPLHTQQNLYERIDHCMSDLRANARKGDFSFADEFSIVTNVEYSAPAIVYDIHDKFYTLRKDIIDDDATPLSLQDVVEASEGYDAESDNLSLYRATFNKAVTEWDYYRKHQNNTESYFDDSKIKNQSAYQQYDYDSLTGAAWFSMVLGFAIGSFGVGCVSSSTRRSQGYHQRKAVRDEQITALNLMSGRDTPIL